jgi:glyoxylase-like metal-dependent hydrolase (beta-lactamase superfamily II)
MLQIQTVVSMPFEENTYILWDSPRTEAVVIDPGLQPELILEALQEHSLTVTAILNTHGHADHIGGNRDLKASFPAAPLMIGEHEAPMLTDANLNLSAPFGMPVTSPAADRLLREGDVVEVGGLRLEVLEIPGHSPGHIVFLVRGEPCLVFGGDVLFRGSVGRTDFPGGSSQQLADGIRGKLFTLPPNTVVYPGHGPATKVAYERRTNPFVGDSA